MTTDKAAIEGLIAIAEKAMPLRDRALRTADSLVLRALDEALPALQRLLAGETREAIDADQAIKTLNGVALHALIDFSHNKISMEHAAAIIANESLRLFLRYASPSPHDDAGAVDYEDAAIDICHECGLDDNENTIRDIVRILSKHTSEDPHHG